MMPGMSSSADTDLADRHSGPAEPEPESPADRRIRVAIESLGQILPALLAQIFPNSDTGTSVPPVPGRIDCVECSSTLNDLRSALAGIEMHLESGHSFWPAEQHAVFLDAHKLALNISRVLRYTRHIERIQGDVDPYALVTESAPDTTGTPANSPERLSAVLARQGPSPLYDPSTDDLEPAEPRLHVASDEPGGFLDGGGDAIPAAAPVEPVPVP